MQRKNVKQAAVTHVVILVVRFAIYFRYVSNLTLLLIHYFMVNYIISENRHIGLRKQKNSLVSS
jgi:hypothetical protein